MKLSELFPSLIGRLMRNFGWSPVGKTMQILIEEAADSSLIGTRLFGVIVGLSKDGSAIFQAEEGDQIKLLPRHLGYGFHYLSVGRVSVYLATDEQHSGRDTRFASGMISLAG